MLRRQLAQERTLLPAVDPAAHPRHPPGAPARPAQRGPLARQLHRAGGGAGCGGGRTCAAAGTTPLIRHSLSGWRLLDAAELLGQEIDHPGRTDLYPFDRGVLFLQHLPVVGLVSVATGSWPA
ncbi:MAG: hypothetical protein R2746_02205 [Acidimicrobiales bacterium]